MLTITQIQYCILVDGPPPNFFRTLHCSKNGTLRKYNPQLFIPPFSEWRALLILFQSHKKNGFSFFFPSLSSSLSYTNFWTARGRKKKNLSHSHGILEGGGSKKEESQMFLVCFGFFLLPLRKLSHRYVVPKCMVSLIVTPLRRRLWCQFMRCNLGTLL